MFKQIAFAAAVLSSSGLNAAFAVTPSENIETLRNMSFAPGGVWEEGEIQVKQRRCSADGAYQDGKYRSFITYAQGEPAVTLDSKGTFYVTYSYSCRIRTRIVSGCGGSQTNTDDNHESGYITLPVKLAFNPASYELTADPKLAEASLGGHELCGQGLVQAITLNLKDKVVSRL
jgi:hypothetical protein